MKSRIYLVSLFLGEDVSISPKSWKLKMMMNLNHLDRIRLKEEMMVGKKARRVRKSKTPVLDNFGRDLTALAEEGKLRPCCGAPKGNRTHFTDFESS